MNGKKIWIFALIFLVFAIDSYAVPDFIIENKTSSLFIVNGTTGNIFMAPSFGNVGIGTTSSGNKLTVVGNINSTRSVYAGDTTINSTGIIFPDQSVQSTAVSATIGGGWTDDGSVVRLGAPTDFVGIGTSNPSEKLYVVGNGTFTADVVVGGNLIAIDSGGGSGSALLGWADDGTVVRLISSTDLVGIGTTNPLATLHVNGSGANGGFIVTNGSGYTAFFVNSTSGNVGIGTTNPAYPLVIQTSGTGTTVNSNIVARLQANGAGYASTLQFSDNVVWDASITMINGSLNFLVPGFGIVPSFIIKATTGNVGINTTAPAQTLTVAGTLNVTPAGYGLTPSLFVTSSGKVGIGTAKPLDILEVAGAGAGISFNNTQVVDGKKWRIVTSTNDLRFTEAGVVDTITLQAGGNVGIGTTAPAEKLVVIGNANVSGTLNVSGRIAFANLASCTGDIESDANGVLSCGTDVGSSGGNVNTTYLNVSKTVLLATDGVSNVGIGTTNPAYRLTIENGTSTGNTLNVSNILFVNGSAGYVGIGTTSPGAKFQVNSDATVARWVADTGTNSIYERWVNTGGNFFVGRDSSAGTAIGTAGLAYAGSVWVESNHALQFGTNNLNRMVIAADGNVGIGTTTPSETLSVNGNMSIEGTNCRDSGGSATCNNFVDFAELFHSSEEVEPGDVVVIDFANENKVKKSSKQYDTSVAGIVSTQPAMVIEGNRIVAMNTNIVQGKTTKPAIALAGRVPVKVTDENGMINAGDLITTSGITGHAMKCIKPIDCVGSILGVAMESQNNSIDKIMVMVK
mgnify:CR=1 FL=1